MYKVYFNQRQVVLTDNISDYNKSHENILVKYTSKSDIKALLDNFEFENHLKCLVIFYDDLKTLKAVFNACFTKVSAAGGLVMNSKDQFLFIKRLRKWDLPKGKRDKNEKISDTALREISEECGIDELEILKKLNFTYHCYYFEGKKILKKTNWYLVNYKGTKDPVPEEKENITKIKWFNESEFSAIKENTYPSIIDVIDKYLKIKKE